MNRETFAAVALDARRLATVAALAAVVVLLDAAVLGFAGTQTVGDAIRQFVTVTVGAYVGMTIVEVAIRRESRASAGREERDENGNR